MSKIHCYICYTTDVDEDYVCDNCEQHYCWDCSCTYNIHTQCDSNLCYECANHSRKKSLTKSMIRDNKLLLLLN
jgi:hypothetical protein